MNCLMSATVCVRLNLATILEPSARRNWMDVAGSDSLTPAHGVEAEEAGGVVEVLGDAPLEGPRQHMIKCWDHVACMYFTLGSGAALEHWYNTLQRCFSLVLLLHYNFLVVATLLCMTRSAR